MSTAGGPLPVSNRRHGPEAPGPGAPDQEALERLADLVRRHRSTVLTGAGCSTDSGIPDYRGPDGRLKTRLPMRFQEFMGDPEARRRYWARSMVGWPRFSAARPNEAHRALARLERDGRVCGVITQNVDGLHQAAGSRRVVDLHGALGRVRCMGCEVRFERERVQDWLRLANPGFEESAGGCPAPGPGDDVAPGGPASRPDGDVALDPPAERTFIVPVCPACGGVLKPDVVFFGESVPGGTLGRAWDVFEGGDALLVAGSSLTVFSGRRFVLRAHKEGRPVVILNLGPTRADELAAHKVERPLGSLLPGLLEALTA